MCAFVKRIFLFFSFLGNFFDLRKIFFIFYSYNEAFKKR